MISKRVSAMADRSENAVELCRRFYKEFDRNDLDGVVGVFAHDAVIEIGAGNSASAVEYSEVIRGSEKIQDYYRGRFERGKHATAPLRPLCGIVKLPCIFFPWIIFSGEIRDELSDGTVLYQGNFLHVWTVDAQAQHINFLSMHLESSGRVAPIKQ